MTEDDAMAREDGGGGGVDVVGCWGLPFLSTTPEDVVI